MKTGSEYANWEQYGSEKGSGNPLLGMLIQKTGLEDFLNGVGVSAASGQLAPLKPVAPPVAPPVAAQPVQPVQPPVAPMTSNVQITPIPNRPSLTPQTLYPNGYSILKGL